MSMLVVIPELGPWAIGLLCLHYVGLGLCVWIGFRVVGEQVRRVAVPDGDRLRGNGDGSASALPIYSPGWPMTVLLFAAIWPMILVSSVLFFLALMFSRGASWNSGDGLIIRFAASMLIVALYLATVWPLSWTALQ